MNANLSIVLDETKVIRLDLLKDLPLTAIDQYTTLKPASSKIKEEYQDLIEEFLVEHKEYIDTFKKQSNKRGSLVIVYEDENKKLHKMRVLYQKDIKKLDTTLVLKGICTAIRSRKDPNYTIQLMKHFDFFLGSEFNLKTIREIQLRPSNNEKILKNQNQRLINLIRNNLLYSLEKNYERGYFFLRLIDSYIEKTGLETTKRVLKTKAGTIQYTQNAFPEQPVLKKENPYSNTVTKREDSLFWLEEDGQYTFFSPKEETKSLKRYRK